MEVVERSSTVYGLYYGGQSRQLKVRSVSFFSMQCCILCIALRAVSSFSRRVFSLDDFRQFFVFSFSSSSPPRPDNSFVSLPYDDACFWARRELVSEKAVRLILSQHSLANSG